MAVAPVAAACAATAVVGTAGTRSVFKSFSRAPSQMEVLKQIVTKHIEDASLIDIASKDDFTVTSTERGVTTWKYQHIVTALDILTDYQKRRCARLFKARLRRDFKHDPRTRAIELLKRWLRNNAANDEIRENDVRSIIGVCRDVMDHSEHFPSRNPLSFMQAIAGVYDHLNLQLREILQRDKTCAELAEQVVCLSRNLIADSIGFLLVGPTDLKKSDELPSLEVVALWQCLPSESHPLPARIELDMQKKMKDMWLTQCGSLIAGLLQTSWCVRLFEGSGARDDAPAIEAALGNLDSATLIDMPALIETIRSEFLSMKNSSRSGLAGSFRKKQQQAVREHYLKAVELLFDLTFLIAEALAQFHLISDGLGDYGMIRVSTWLHPFLGALMEKVVQLKTNLESLNHAVDEHLVVAKAKGRPVEKPAPSQNMSKRARATIDRAVIANGSHSQRLLVAMEELKKRSSPDRLPKVVQGLGDACLQLDAVLSSSQFRACVGPDFPVLPRLADVALGSVQNQCESITCPTSDEMLDSDFDDRRLPFEIVDLSEVHEEEKENAAPTDLHSNAVTLREAAASREKKELLDSEIFEHDHMAILECPQNEPVTFGSAHDECTSFGENGVNEFAHLVVEVTRVVSAICGPGFRRHDRRALRLKGSFLEIFNKGSSITVKSVIDVRHELEDCCLLPGGKIMSLVFRRVPKGVDIDAGVWKNKGYIFEFDTKEIAMLFYVELCNLQDLSA